MVNQTKTSTYSDQMATTHTNPTSILSSIDPSMALNRAPDADQSKPTWLFVHVNDLVFGGFWNEEFKTKINQHFEMEDLGLIKYALGIRITQLKDHISLIQDKFIKNILEEFNLTNCRHTTSPLPGNSKSFKHLPAKSIDHLFNYRRAIGLLQYLVQCTRPDLSFPIPRRPQRPSLQCRQNSLKHQQDHILGFTDSDWGGSVESKSFSASIIYYHGTLGWRSHKQKVVALSSAEAEYNAATEATQDLLWTKNLLLESTNLKPKLTLFTDNQSTIAIASNHVYHHGTRHINFRLHFIRNLLENQELKLNYLETSRMIADSLTKNNPYNKSIDHLKIIFSNNDLSSKEE
ncbi:hypothetical protein O181_077007 [Austropuccinia psidii MF-1]|uniref:Reverse transcriptase Ty1/copia-type domain-containing protein n=1 Tax=Austropuccinia psidii MF-1 TaxID=1389203 RepID=A0A9Q3FFB0_9BASI|nr:hypothetical protein [Austropuccinia psidii MF-1]